MKPPAFTYHDPRSVDEACDLLATFENARPLAGGQSLMPLLNFRAVAPDHLIDLNKVAGLDGIALDGDVLRVGAMTRQCALERSTEIGMRCPILRDALRHVGHRQTRNRGTFGGSLCHLDPSAELVNVTALLAGTLQVASKRGRRAIAFPDFAAGFLTTTLEPDELLVEICLPLPARGHGRAFVEFSRRHGDFAMVACSALIDLDERGDIARAVLAVSGTGPAPVRPQAIEDGLRGQRPEAATFRAAAAEAGKLETMGDVHVSAAYRSHLARILTYRALEQAARSALEQRDG